MKATLLIVLVLILLSLTPVMVLAGEVEQTPALFPFLDEHDPDQPIIVFPDETILDQIEDWAIGALLSAGLLAVVVTGSVSTLKSTVLSAIRDNEQAGKWFRYEIWNGFSVYQIIILVLTYAASYFVVAQQLDFNPWIVSPFEGLANLDITLQNLMSAFLVFILAISEHQAFDRWLQKRQSS